MPLNLSNRDQNSGHRFYNRRLRAAITRFSVRMTHDDRKQQAALVLSVVFVMLGCGWMALLHFMKPSGLVGQSAIVGNRDTGALYAKIEGRLHPALNLTSARLATGRALSPTWVTSQEIGKYPTGPMIGIPGIPDDLAVAGNPLSAWAVCDTASARGGPNAPTVTAIGGELTVGDRAAPMGPASAILTSYRRSTYLIWNGQRSRIDPADRAVTFNLGLDPGKTRPVEISNALFDAVPATEPLVAPSVPGAGTPSRWLPGSVVGRVLQTKDASGIVSGFYVLLSNGVQKITAFVADLLRTADSQGAVQPQLVAPDRLVDIPEVEVLEVSFYPTGKLEFIDTAANPVSCVSWKKLSTDRQATITVFNGRGLPIPQGFDSHIVGLVRDSRGPDSVEAQQTLMLPGSANFTASTSGAITADTRESLFWVSPQGVRYGIDRDPNTVQALGIDPLRAVQAPWPILRTFAAGPPISRGNALLARDIIEPGGAMAVLPPSGPHDTGG
ncbi:type VII secretion protein EccB [Mycolicibacterium sp.]|uniref:type VII secretion protein EccB n=1 Tax=Mycolicibacterium sp. TaxID=2320850 RepID=UPI001A2E6827|nr:type VII secretion protein EccB [Mycolicibacterium sp.]MBJ7400428.1 type VII secretion protein EccB [Mycolicibacterium sp.]